MECSFSEILHPNLCRRPKPFAFIEFLDYNEAKDAKENLDRRDFQGRQVRTAHHSSSKKKSYVMFQLSFRWEVSTYFSFCALRDVLNETVQLRRSMSSSRSSDVKRRIRCGPETRVVVPAATRLPDAPAHHRAVLVPRRGGASRARRW